MAGVPSLGRVQIASQRDFSGGLNLTNDAYNLDPSESPDLSNVNLIPRGGFELRQGVKKYGGTGLSTATTTLHFPFATAEGLGAAGAGTNKYVFLFEVISGGAKTIWHTTSATGNWTSLTTAKTVATPIRTAQAASAENNITCIYFVNYTDVSSKWDGTTYAALLDPADSAGGLTWNEVLTAPGQGNMPKAKCIANYAGSMWVGNLLEQSTPRPNRIRFSHPNEPEDWRVNDYIDVALAEDGDQITALAALHDRLLIFKHRSIYVLSGFDADSFQLTPLSQRVGTVSQETVAVTEHGVFFYDKSSGVHLITLDGEVQYLFQNIRPAIDDGTIVSGAALTSYASVLYANQKVYCSVPWVAGSTYSTRTFVYDLLLGEEGGWTAYDFNSYGGVVQTAQGLDDSLVLAGLNSGAARPFYLDVQDAYDLWDGSTTVAIASYYVTSWFDAKLPAVQKRFRRPTFLMQDFSDGTVYWYSYEDFDPTNLSKSGSVLLTSIGSLLTYGPTGSSVLGTAKWAGPSTNRSSPKKGGTLGNAYAVQLKFVGPSEKIHWGVNHISYRYILKRIR